MEDILGQVLRAFAAEKQELEGQLAELDAREKAVREALTLDGRSIARRPSVPDDKYEEVISYLRKHPESRQADIAKDLDLNSGIISSAMKVALGRHEATVDRPGRGARYTAIEGQ